MGKHLRCPSCGIQFQAQPAAPAPMPMPMPAPAPDPGVIVPCPRCARKLRVPAASVGKVLKCPGCGEQFSSGPARPDLSRLPAQLAPFPVPGGAAAESAPVESEEEGWEEVPQRRRKKKKKKNASTGVIAGIGGGFLGVLVVLGLIIKGASLFTGGGGDIPEDEWQKFTPPGERLSVDMPGDPKSMQFPGMSAAYSVERDRGNLAYLIGWADLPGPIPPGLIDQALEEACNEATRSVEGTVQGKTRINVAGHPGIELAVHSRKYNGIFVARYFITKNRVFVLAAGGKWLKADSKDVRRFFESFKF
jgi:hypothetical protein